MDRRRRLAAATGITVILLASTAALAAGPGTPYRGRAGRWEVTLQPHYVSSENIGFANGTQVDIDDDLGFGFGFGYNFTENLALHFDWSWSSSNYRAHVTTDNSGIIGSADLSGTLDTGTIALNLSYYFLKGPLTPFVIGGVGWTYIDSNIPSGLPQGVCWWDPWYGQVCSTSQPTYSADEFSYNLGLGLRFDVTPGFFLRGIVGKQWIDLSKSSGTPDFNTGRLDIGFSF